jgi:hypothetical protein
VQDIHISKTAAARERVKVAAWAHRLQGDYSDEHEQQEQHPTRPRLAVHAGGMVDYTAGAHLAHTIPTCALCMHDRSVHEDTGGVKTSATHCERDKKAGREAGGGSEAAHTDQASTCACC